MILITGASGNAGTSVIKHLVRRGERVRALTSNETSAEKLKARGVAETIVGDLRSDADVVKATNGVEAVVHLAPSVMEDESEMGFRSVSAAKAAGVEHFCYISCFHSQISSMRHHVSKRRVEEVVFESGLSYTVLQPSMFMQNLDHIWQGLQQGVFQWPWSPEQYYCMVDTDDLGEATANVLADRKYRGGCFEICSADTVTGVEMAAMISEAWGRPIEARRGDAKAFGDMMRAGGTPEWSIETVMGMCKYHDDHGYSGGNAVVARMVLGREPTDYRTFVRRYLQDHGAIPATQVAAQ